MHGVLNETGRMLSGVGVALRGFRDFKQPETANDLQPAGTNVNTGNGRGNFVRNLFVVGGDCVNGNKPCRSEDALPCPVDLGFGV